MNQKAVALRTAAQEEYEGHSPLGYEPLADTGDHTGDALEDFNAIMCYWPALRQDPEAAVLALLLAAEIVAEPDYRRGDYKFERA